MIRLREVSCRNSLMWFDTKNLIGLETELDFKICSANFK